MNGWDEEDDEEEEEDAYVRPKPEGRGSRGRREAVVEEDDWEDWGADGWRLSWARDPYSMTAARS